MSNLRFVFVFFLFFVFFSCDKDAEVISSEYPYIITNAPKVNESGVEFSANVINLADQEILKYGFIWSEELKPTLMDYKKIFDEKTFEDTYKCQITGGFAKNHEYFVRAYVLTTRNEIYSNIKSFNSQGSLPVIINDFSPKYGSVGLKVSIEGDNFALSKKGNIVKFGETEAMVDSFSEQKLIVTVPQITKPEEVTLSIEAGGKTTYSEHVFDIWFPWKKVFEKEGLYYYYPIGIETEDRLFFGLGYDNSTLWEFDPELKEIYKKSSIPIVNKFSPISFTVNNRVYVLLSNGHVSYNSASELWEYNPESDIWTRKADFPGHKITNATAFNINDKGYIVLGKYWEENPTYEVFYSKELWEYNPDSDVWIRKSDFPGPDMAEAIAFTLDTYSYVGIGSDDGNAKKCIYRYSQINDTWEYCCDYPGDGFINVKDFLIDEKWYVGFGSDYDANYFYDFWEFDISLKSWREMRSFPFDLNNHNNLVSFAKDDKGYIGAIVHQGNEIFNCVFYEFDPSKN